MAITIVATAGSASANSFVTEVEQIAYMAARLNSDDWTTKTGSTLTEDEKAALIEATRDLDALTWVGYRTDNTQALAWPRRWVVDPDDPAVASYFDTDELPTRLKNATCELAFQYIKAGTTDVAALDSKTGVKRKRVDVLETEWFGASTTPTGLARYPRVLNWILPLLANAGMTTPVVRG